MSSLVLFSFASPATVRAMAHGVIGRDPVVCTETLSPVPEDVHVSSMSYED